MKNKYILIIIILVIIIGGVIFWNSKESDIVKVANFEECLRAGYTIMESYPRQCRTPDDQTFVEDIGNELEKIDLIRINTPRPNQIIKSPLNIEGEARGVWFFEGDFPIKLLDENDNIIGTAIAETEGEWMTEDFVSFKAELEFETPATEHATLILEKDNPSGLPENADELRVPVIINLD